MDEAMMARVQQFAERALGEAAATAGLALARVGDRLGLWQAMAGAGPLTPAELAEAFRSGAGIGWHQHHPDLYGESAERGARQLYRDQLLPLWIPALDGVAARLQQGASVADVGCGSGVATILMAQAYPRSSFAGFHTHDVAIARARKAAAQAGLSDRVAFEVASATAFPGRYDLVCFLDALHDLGDPVGALTHARRALTDGGTVLVVEPRAPDRLEDNLTPLGRLFYAFSTGWCVPSGLSEPPALGLGNQVGQVRLRELVAEAGFGDIRLAVDGPFNFVFEIRP